MGSRNRLVGRLALAAALIVALATSGLLRSYHVATPRLPFLPFPIDSLLFLAAGLLTALHIVQRRQGADLWPVDPSPRGPSLAQVVPLLLVLLGEKWFSNDLLGGAFGWIDCLADHPALADALYRLWTGLGLLGAGLVFLLVLRQIWPYLGRTATLSRGLTALGIVLGGLVVCWCISGGMRWFIDGARWMTAYPWGLVWVSSAGAQVVRGGAEEFFYRGLVQTALLRLLVRSGAPEGRLVRLAAILAVSCSFTLEHVDPRIPWNRAWPALLFVFAMSAVFGILFEVSRNLYLVMGAHTGVNLLVAGLIPAAANSEGQLFLRPPVMSVIFLLVLFLGVVAAHRRRGFA